jgi:hypothetical protein
MNSNRGSIWRRWDLHLHTPDTKLSNAYKDSRDIWIKYIKYLEESDVQVFGITDYFSADGYFSLIDRYKTEFPNSEKVFFPNIEFRLVEAMSKNNSNPNIHVIFDNDPSHCSKVKIEMFLSRLNTSAVDGSGVRITCSELQSQADFESASVSLDDLKAALKNIPLNPELAVIIGNKGSCKSALVDIIGLLGESAQEAYFSFLSNKGTPSLS